MHSLIHKINKAFVLFGSILLLVSCGGGGSSGGFTGGGDTLRVEIIVDKSVLQANLINAFPDDATVFTTDVTVRVFDEEGKLFSGGTVSIDIDTGLDSGSLLYTDLGDGDPDTDEDEIPLFWRRVVFEDSTGIENALVQSSRRTGVIVLVATIVDPASNSTASARAEITVVDGARPVSSLTFTGPFVDAVRAGEAFFLGNGTFTRGINIIASDANGQPVTPDTEIEFFLIDHPVVGFPGNGPGSFLIAGSDGDPEEGGVLFSANSGNFINEGLRRFDRLVLDGTQSNLPDNRDLTGIRVVDSVISNTMLNINSGEPFNINGVGNNGASVPYVAGRAQFGTVLLKGFTDLLGVATTTLTYPAQRLGQTAILVACTTDKSVCTVLNTCDANGNNCNSVYLPVAAGLTLTSSVTDVPGNTAADVELCVRGTDGVGVQGATIDYDINGNQGNSSVTVNGDLATSGTVITGADGCVVATIASAGVIPNSNLSVDFITDGVDTPTTVNITPPGSLNLSGTVECDLPEEMNDAACGAPLDCTANLLVIDDIGTAIPGVVINTTDSANITNLTFNPAFTNTAGNVAGMTDNTGQNTSTFSIEGVDDIVQIPNPNFDPNDPNSEATIDATETTYTGNITYDIVGGASSEFDFGVNGVTCIQP